MRYSKEQLNKMLLDKSIVINDVLVDENLDKVEVSFYSKIEAIDENFEEEKYEVDYSDLMEEIERMEEADVRYEYGIFQIFLNFECDFSGCSMEWIDLSKEEVGHYIINLLKD